MQLSIVLPVYNVEPYLRECINSIYQQNLINFELIAINDGSTDNSLKILKEYEKNTEIFT
ncbi:glycosyltransferase family 2 protein [Priestia flexa]|uniref:glycosyltransferase family 2 protein n=1 Tax=Priestia flexa TaxID=86664 RepID=UPI000C240B9B